jgi:tetratricopeptide (TPR) repeat protein
MAERYTRLFALSGKLYTPGSPVIIEAGALLKDNQLNRVLAQIKLKSISPKEIKAVKVRISPLDVTGVALGQAVDHAYLDLTVCQDDSFGQQSPVVMQNADTRGFTVAVTEVVFADNTIWNGSGAWNTLTEPTPVESVYPDAIIQDQFHIEMGQVCACMPTDTQDLWYCACGALNHQTEQTCHACGRDHRELVALVSSLTAEKLQAAYEAQQEREAQERAAAQAEAERKAAIAKREAAKRRRKNRKVAAIVAVIAVVVVAGYLATANFVIPHVNNQRAYTSAEALLNEGNYEEAIKAFTALGDYKDSTQRIAEANELRNEATERELAAQYAEAETLLEAGEYDAAIEAFKALGEYEDSSDRIDEVYYLSGKNSMQDTDYLSAYQSFSNANFYQDSEVLMIDCAEALGAEAYSDGSYQDAVEWYEKAEDIDSANDAKYNFIQENRNNTNKFTYDYLCDLTEIEYEDSQAIYDDLYTVRVDVLINTKETDHTTDTSELLYYTSFQTVYIHCKMSGGTPYQTLSCEINTVAYGNQWAPGQITRDSDEITLSAANWVDHPYCYTDKMGEIDITVSDKESGEIFDERSISVSYYGG